MLSFNDFVKVFDAYGKYVSQASQEPQAPQAPQAPQEPQEPQEPQAPQEPDNITQMLTKMQAQINQMQTPAPHISTVNPLSVDDVIAKIFE